ncbi:hypothetical protein [Schumannella luteola]
MSRLSRISSRLALGALVLGGLTFAAAPVGAHTGSLFTIDDETTTNFATISGTDASVASFGPAIPDNYSVEGIEIFNEVGYVLLSEEIDDDTEVTYIATWDHSTGALGTLVELVGGVNVSVNEVYGLDTTNDGTILAFAEVTVIEGEFPIDHEWVVSINPTTGEVTEVVDITGVTPYKDSLATDPTTGITYAFVDTDDGMPQFLQLDLVAGTYTGPTDLDELQATVGPGYVYGADFDTAGTLWFYYSGFEGNGGLSYTTGPFSETVEGVTVGDPSVDVDEINLAYDPYVAPQLAATGLPLLPLAVAGAGLLGLGGLAFASRRRAA